MGFMKKVWKPLAQLGASFIPGVGPLVSAVIGAIPGGDGGGGGGLGGLLGGLGGMAAGAFGASGNQGGADYNSQTIQNLLQNMQGKQSGQEQGTEDPLMTAFRSSLFQPAQDFLDKAGAPVYGDETKANFLTQQNDLYKQAGDNLRSQMAARGLTDSGANAQGLGDIEMQRAGQVGQFFGNLPFMERQAQMQNMGNALGLLTNWAGRGPQGRTFSSENSSTATTQGTNTMQGQTRQQGPGFLKNLATIGGAAAMDKAADWMKNKAKPGIPTNIFSTPVYNTGQRSPTGEY